MSNYSLANLIAHCKKDDPLNEIWLWAQATGLAISIAIAGCALLTVSNLLVITYTAFMSKICSTDFNLSAYTSWQETASTAAIAVGAAIAVAAVFVKLSLRARYGSAAVKRNIRLALSLDETAKLCQSILPANVDIHKGVPGAGQLMMHLPLEHSHFWTQHLVLRAISVDAHETTILIHAMPLLNSQWSLLSAFFSDFGQNKDQVDSIHAALQPYMSNKRRRTQAAEKRRQGISYDQVLREAPPKLRRAES